MYVFGRVGCLAMILVPLGMTPVVATEVRTCPTAIPPKIMLPVASVSTARVVPEIEPLNLASMTMSAGSGASLVNTVNTQ